MGTVSKLNNGVIILENPQFDLPCKGLEDWILCQLSFTSSYSSYISFFKKMDVISINSLTLSWWLFAGQG